MARKVHSEDDVGPWCVISLCTSHNHLVAANPRETAAPKLSHGEEEEAFRLSREGVSASIVRDLLQHRRGDHAVMYQQILNTIYKSKREYENGRSDLNVLLDQMKKAGSYYKVNESIDI